MDSKEIFSEIKGELDEIRYLNKKIKKSKIWTIILCGIDTIMNDGESIDNITADEKRLNVLKYKMSFRQMFFEVPTIELCNKIALKLEEEYPGDRAKLIAHEVPNKDTNNVSAKKFQFGVELTKANIQVLFPEFEMMCKPDEKIDAMDVLLNSNYDMYKYGLLTGENKCLEKNGCQGVADSLIEKNIENAYDFKNHIQEK